MVAKIEKSLNKNVFQISFFKTFFFRFIPIEKVFVEEFLIYKLLSEKHQQQENIQIIFLKSRKEQSNLEQKIKFQKNKVNLFLADTLLLQH